MNVISKLSGIYAESEDIEKHSFVPRLREHEQSYNRSRVQNHMQESPRLTFSKSTPVYTTLTHQRT